MDLATTTKAKSGQDAYDGMLAQKHKAVSQLWEIEDSSMLPIGASSSAPASTAVSCVSAGKGQGKVKPRNSSAQGEATTPGLKQLTNALKGRKDVILASTRARRHLMKPLNVLGDKLRLAMDTCRAALKEIWQDFPSEDCACSVKRCSCRFMSTLC